MTKWKVVKSIHQFVEDDQPRKFLEASLFVTSSKREAFRQFAVHLCEAEIFSESHYCFSQGELIFKYRSPSGFYVHHIELLRNGTIYDKMTDKELLLIKKFRQSVR